MTENTKSYPSFKIMLVDDEESYLRTARLVLNADGLSNIELVSDSREVPAKLLEGGYGVIALDMNMPYMSGKELLETISTDFPEIIVVMITGTNEVETAVECMRQGAFDYLVKPVDHDRLVNGVRRAVEHRTMQLEAATLKEYVLDHTLKHPEAFARIITKNEKMHNIFQYAEAIAKTDLPVLITGETGVGKELMAQAIHTLSGRTGSFVPVDIAGIDDNMFTDSLFGHTKGAFTGAEKERRGLIEEARGGTLFLDEIGDLKTVSQVKLLRLIQEGTYYPVGSDVAKRSQARILLATNRDMNAMVNREAFRRDLYYRLQAHQITLPPLRMRMDDIPLLTAQLVEEACLKLEKKMPSLPKELFTLLETYSFPGNIRELRGLIFDAISRHVKGTLSLAFLKEKLQENRGSNAITANGKPDLPGTTGETGENSGLQFPDHFPTLKEVEDRMIEEALKRTKGNKTLAADLLGLTRQTLNNRLRK